MNLSGVYELPIDSLSVNVIIYEWDKDDFIIIDLNKKALKTEKILKQDVVGKHLGKIYPTIHSLGLFEILKNVYDTGRSEIFNNNLYTDSISSGWRKNEIIKLGNGNILVMYQDISKEKRLEKIVKRVNSFIDDSQTIVFFWKADENWTVEYVSCNITDFGYSREDFLSGRVHYNDIIHSDDIEKVTSEVKYNVDKKIDKFKQIYRIICADGSIRWIDDRTVVQRDENSNPTNYLGTITDITESIETQLKLKASEELFHAISENSLMGIFIYQDTYKYVNPAIVDMIGYSADELYEMSPLAFISEELKPELQKNIDKRLNGEKFPKTYTDIDFLTKDGKIKIARLMVETITYKDSFAGLGTIIDITDMKLISSKLQMLAQAVEQTDDMVMITDKEGVITFVNDAYIMHSGYKHNELIGKTPRVVKSTMHEKEFYEVMWESIVSGECFSGIIVNSKKSGELYHIEATITPIYNTKNEIISYVATAKDITSRIQMENELNRRANLDSLTGIFNRYRGNEIIDTEIEKLQRYDTGFAILMLDIDHFKNVNDTYGHDIGDEVLIQLTKLITVHMRKSDHFIRWGGEEFIIISEHLNEEKATQFAQKLRKTIASYEFDLSVELDVTVSFGVSVVTKDDDKKSLLKRVDEALYEAKDNGRNCVVFH